jgi:hypothetical protein
MCSRSASGADDGTIKGDLSGESFDQVEPGACLHQHLAATGVGDVVLGLDRLPCLETMLTERSRRLWTGSDGFVID